MADISSVSITEEYALPKKTPNHTKSLGKDEFLNVLITQLQNQDPTEPTDTSDMVNQLVQFSMMDSISSMTTATMQSQAYSLIGKAIVGVQRNYDTGESTDVIGTVDGAGVESGKPYVLVGETKVLVEDILQVFDKTILTGSSESAQAATSLVGKYIRANIGVSEDPIYVEGKVDRWMTEEGVVFLTINGQNVSLHQVIAVADTEAALGERPAPPSNSNAEQGET